MITEIQNEFKKHVIESEDDNYSTGFDLSFEFDDKICIKVHDVWTNKVPEVKSIVSGLNLIKTTNEINFNVYWSAYQSRYTNEFLLCSVNDDLGVIGKYFWRNFGKLFY